MSGQEKCPIYPSMLKAYCSHCQGTGRGTAANPKFSLREATFKGHPVAEILKDGASIHIWDDHFQFGRRKAEMLVACIDVLRDFWRSNGDEDDIFVPRVIENQGRASVFERMWKRILILNAPMARRLKNLGCGYKRCPRTMTTSVSAC